MLGYGMGGSDVMAGQLGKLIEVATLPNVSLGIVPTRPDRVAWSVEDFWIYDDSRVTVELVSGHLTLTQPHDVELYARADSAASGPLAGRRRWLLDVVEEVASRVGSRPSRAVLFQSRGVSAAQRRASCWRAPVQPGPRRTVRDRSARRLPRRTCRPRRRAGAVWSGGAMASRARARRPRMAAALSRTAT